MRRILIATVAAGLGLAAVATANAHGPQGLGGPGGLRAQPAQMQPEGGPGPGPGRDMRGGFARMCENMDARTAAMLAYARERLDITQEQEAAWQQLTQAVEQARAPMEQVCTQLQTGEAADTLPERLERVQMVMQARLQQLQTIQPAVENLYQTLTEEQRQIADRMGVMHGHRGGRF